MEPVEYIKLLVWVSGLVAAPLAATQAVIKSGFNKDVGLQLASFDPSKWFAKLPGMITATFDEIFGNKHFTKKCFIRSSIISVAMLTVIIISFHSFVADQSLTKFINTLANQALLADMRSGIILTLFVTMNVIPDYFSLLETRIVVRRIKDNPTAMRVLFLLSIDLIATAAIFIFYCICVYIFIYLAYSEPINWKLIIDRSMVSLNTEFPSNPEDSIRYFTYYTTFATSIWIWLISLLSVIITIMQKIEGRLWERLFQTVLNVEEKPFQSLAWLAVASIAIIFIFSAPFVVKF